MVEATNHHPAFGPLSQVDAGLLRVGYADIGPADGRVAVLLHGWPYDIHSYVEVAPLLAAAGYRVVVPYLRGFGTTRFLSDARLRNGEQAALALDVIALLDALGIERAVLAGFDWGARTADIVAARWYQYYFATERGRVGYDHNRRDFAKLIWRTASPKWTFDDATFDRSAAAFDNPDHVEIVIHNYRWRLGLADGESEYAELEGRLAQRPVIGVPTITLEGDANGAPHPDPNSYAEKFSGTYSHRTIEGGIGHNLPQEAPEAFANAIIEVDAS
jgi:pimeloyl-ACP methyl ester carboxylesterase